MKLDILAIGAHPDDIELSAGGTLINHIKKGFKAGIVDLTKGELGTRGSAEIRSKESADASRVLGISVRENLEMKDGFFAETDDSLLAIVKVIRKYQPEIILCNAISDRHPDHGRASQLISRAVFLSGLKKVSTNENGNPQSDWKTKAVYHGIQDRFIKPDFVADVSDVWEKKMEAILCYSSQFYSENSKEPVTAISTKEFLEFLKARAAEFGRQAGFAFAEGFTVERYPGITDLFVLK